MPKRKNTDQANASPQALKQYKQFVEEKGDNPIHHQASVLFSKWNYNRIFEIGIVIDGSNAKVIICGDNEFSRDYKSVYTNQNHIFRYMPSGVLIIRDVEDNWGNKVEIDISYRGL